MSAVAKPKSWLRFLELSIVVFLLILFLGFSYFQIPDFFLYSILFSYFLLFALFALIYGRTHLKSHPQNTDKEMGEYDRQETNSETLAGFALTGVTLLISLFPNELSKAENLLAFFFVALMLEIFSAFEFHLRIIRADKYLGYVLQYSGILAIVLGFGGYINSQLPNYAPFTYIYVLFVLGYLIVTFRELYYSYAAWKAVEVRD